jgi:hypothetical protein
MILPHPWHVTLTQGFRLIENAGCTDAFVYHRRRLETICQDDIGKHSSTYITGGRSCGPRRSCPTARWWSVGSPGCHGCSPASSPSSWVCPRASSWDSGRRRGAATVQRGWIRPVATWWKRGWIPSGECLVPGKISPSVPRIILAIFQRNLTFSI